MKKMKLACLAAASLLMLSVLAGCSAPADPADGDEQQQEQQPADGSESGEPAQVSGVLEKMLESGKLVVGMGGAMDLVVGARRVIIAMLHTNRGAPKIMRQCTLPLTAVGVVDTIVTEMGVIRVTRDGLELTERFADYSVEQIQAATEAPLNIGTNLKVLETL